MNITQRLNETLADTILEDMITDLRIINEAGFWDKVKNAVGGDDSPIKKVVAALVSKYPDSKNQIINTIKGFINQHGEDTFLKLAQTVPNSGDWGKLSRAMLSTKPKAPAGAPKAPEARPEPAKPAEPKAETPKAVETPKAPETPEAPKTESPAGKTEAPTQSGTPKPGEPKNATDISQTMIKVLDYMRQHYQRGEPHFSQAIKKLEGSSDPAQIAKYIGWFKGTVLPSLAKRLEYVTSEYEIARTLRGKIALLITKSEEFLSKNPAK